MLHDLVGDEFLVLGGGDPAFAIPGSDLMEFVEKLYDDPQGMRDEAQRRVDETLKDFESHRNAAAEGFVLWSDYAFNPKFAGEGLSQEMPIEELEAFFKKAVADQVPHRIELGGIETDLLRVECDREHPVWPNHGECNGGPYIVPFGILHELGAIGEELDAVAAPSYRRKLARGAFAPEAPAGMALDTRNPLEVVFGGERLMVGFSGADSSCEGPFGPNSGPLYAIAVERGAITSPDPEWWLADDRQICRGSNQ